jgi:hypothetical protein
MSDFEEESLKLKRAIDRFKPNTNCFVIAPIGDAGSDIRRRSDQVLKHLIAPSAAACGYKAIRADQISEQGIITTQVIQHLIEDELVIADLTGRNPNVFYELAVRHAMRRPYVQIIQTGEKIPFDVAGVRTLEVDYRDLDSVESTKTLIVKTIESMKGHIEVDSPISTSVGLTMLRNVAEFFDSTRQLIEVLEDIRDRIPGPPPSWK